MAQLASLKKESQRSDHPNAAVVPQSSVKEIPLPLTGADTTFTDLSRRTGSRKSIAVKFAT